MRPRDSDFQSIMEVFGMQVTIKSVPNSTNNHSVVNLWMVTETYIVIGSTKVAIYFILSKSQYCTQTYSRLLLNPQFSIFLIVILLIQTLSLTQAKIVAPPRVFQTSLTTGREHNTAETWDWITTLKFKLTSCIIVCIIY